MKGLLGSGRLILFPGTPESPALFRGDLPSFGRRVPRREPEQHGFRFLYQNGKLRWEKAREEPVFT